MPGFIRMRRPERKSTSKKSSQVDVPVHENTSNDEQLSKGFQAKAALECLWEIEFLRHISKYTGQTVTVFVKGGGISGSGFTGILLRPAENYIELVLKPGPAPMCPLGGCFCKKKPYCSSMAYKLGLPKYSGGVRALGSIACIPVDKIASFAHNTV